ncbi:ABC transporter permease [Paeniglutamicibacter cryotolerans]|uniref:Peptide/nickel transport system permease protein n=1 Tax=Paeniglutamicibacter cryotolerans TaxID=670079 RepID=A0A839QM49_9MICC|nr:ABC transporter permease [Paeniglutamicibacter cryotolerans]MBB2995824.1 peptide/nickel transport system permease protein [Paeniglutamicibacter cryotolerans]
MTTESIPKTRTRGRRRWGTNMIIGAVLVGLVAAAAVLSLFWTPFDPVQAFPSERLQGSSPTHLMGTDWLGRDIFSIVLTGAQVTILVGLAAVAIALLVGTPLGILAGMKRGATEEVTMRFADVLLAFPALLVAIVFSAVFGASTMTAMVAIGIGSIPGFARVARAGTLQVMSTEYVQAARASSQPALRVAWRHVMPNIVGMVVVQCSVTFALAVLAEAALSFLGLGTPPPIPSWGRMLQASQNYWGLYPMLAVWPGAAIAAAVMGFNMLGDGLRDRFDPKLNGERS